MDLDNLKGKKIAVGLSGGVDSSTVITMLKNVGANPFGLTMKIWHEGATPVPMFGNACYGPAENLNIESCQRLCKSLDVPYLCVDLSKEYEEHIIKYFKSEYQKGHTPNPCIRCNQEIKFGFMLTRAKELGYDFDYFATGHYVRIEKLDGVSLIRRGLFDPKDQSYFLYRLSPKLLEHVVFPLGGMTKSEVREIARKYGLEMADKTESQDFIPGGYGTLFADSPGDIVDENGKVLGQHKGISHYTIGQRRGIGISVGPEPVYVKALDATNNRVIVSSNGSLFCSCVLGQETVLHIEALKSKAFTAFVRIRQNHKPAKALVTVTGDCAKIEFAEAQRAAAPGQSAVFYDEDGFTLGGCIMTEAS